MASSLDQLLRLIDGLGAEDLGRATPCDGFDVSELLAHLVAVLRKLVVARRGGDSSQVADPASDLDQVLDGPLGRRTSVRAARLDLDQAWADDDSLGRTYTLPWGEMTGHELLDAYTHEFTVHAWDLSQAIGDPTPLDNELAEAALVWFRANVPADDRPQPGPFAPALDVADDADPHTKLAAYLGRPT